MDSSGSQMLLFHDCFPLLGSSQTKWDGVSAANQSITFKVGSDQHGQQEQALYSATQRLHSLPSGSTSPQGKLEH